MTRQAGLPVDSDFAEFHRDGKLGYLEHMPRVNAYVRHRRYGVFAPLLRLLDRLDEREVKIGYTF